MPPKRSKALSRGRGRGKLSMHQPSKPSPPPEEQQDQLDQHVQSNQPDQCNQPANDSPPTSRSQSREPRSPTPPSREGSVDSVASNSTSQPNQLQAKKRAKKIVFSLNAEQEESMLEFLQVHPMIWDCKLSGYRRTDLKAKLWEDQGASMEPPIKSQHLQGWFKSLRDTHTRLHKKKSGDGAPGELTERELWIKNNFDFLNSVIRHRPEPCKSFQRTLMTRYGWIICIGISMLYLCINQVDIARIDSCSQKYNASSGRTCRYCPPGTHKHSDCDVDGGSALCVTCSNGTYQHYCNRADMCAPCDATCLQPYTVMVKGCTLYDNIVCECEDGRYLDPGQVCLTHSKCSAGFGMVKLGNKQDDTDCEECVEGQTYSSGESFEQCSICTKCFKYITTCTTKGDAECSEPWQDKKTMPYTTDASQEKRYSLSTVIIAGVVQLVAFIVVVLLVVVCVKQRRNKRRQLNITQHHIRNQPSQELQVPVSDNSTTNSDTPHCQPLNFLNRRRQDSAANGGDRKSRFSSIEEADTETDQFSFIAQPSSSDRNGPILGLDQQRQKRSENGSKRNPSASPALALKSF